MDQDQGQDLVNFFRSTISEMVDARDTLSSSMISNMTKQIFYISNRDLLQGRARADAIVIIQTCAALARLGNEVTLITPSYTETRHIPDSELWRHFDIPPDAIRLVRLPSKLKEGQTAFRIRISKLFRHFLYSLVVFGVIFRGVPGRVVLVSRDVISTYPYLVILWPLKFLKRFLFIFELHDPANGSAQRMLYRLMDGVLCTTDATAEKLVSEMGVGKGCVITVRNGFNPSSYNTGEDKSDIRKRLGLPHEKKIVMYTGKVAYGFKEIETALKSAASLPEIFFVFVGGKDAPVFRWREYCKRKNINNTMFTGFVDPSEICSYQLAADILLMYYPGDLPVAASVCPTKMVEYMATGNTIISVNFSAIQEVLRDRENAFLLTPDSHELLANCIKEIIGNPGLAHDTARIAKKESVAYSWDSRGRLIAGFIKALGKT